MNPLTDILLPELFIYMSSFLAIQTKCYPLQSVNRTIRQTFDPVKLCRKDRLSFTPSFEQHVEEYQSSSLSNIMTVVPAVKIVVKSLEYLQALECEPSYQQTIDDFYLRLAQSIVSKSRSTAGHSISQRPPSTLKSLHFVEHVWHASQTAHNLNDLVNAVDKLMILLDEQSGQSNDSSIIQSIDQFDDPPFVTLDHLHIQLVDKRSIRDCLEYPIEWINISSMLFSNSLTSLFVELPQGFAFHSDDRINLVCDLPASLTSATLKIGLQPSDIIQLTWLLERSDSLPIIQHLDFDILFPTHQSLSTITETGLPRPFVDLKLVWADDSLKYGSFERVLKLELVFSHEASLDKLSALAYMDSMPHLKSFHLEWSREIAFEIEEVSMSCDLSPVMIFLSKRPLENISLSIDSAYTAWAPLSETALQSLKNLKTMTHFSYQAHRDRDSDVFAVLPFESEDLQSCLPAGCWPLLQSLHFYGDISPVDDIATLARAAPALQVLVFGPHDDQLNDSNWTLRALELVDRYCPTIKEIDFKFWKFHPSSESDHQAAASIHLNLRHLTRLCLGFTRLDDESLHLLLSKICHVPITYFQANWHVDRQSKLRLALQHVLTHLETLALPTSSNIMFPEFYEFQDRGANFPFVDTHKSNWLYTFSQLVNDDGENGRTTFFRMLMNVLSQEELEQLANWNEGHYF